MATGRTASRWFKFQIKDSGATLRDIPVSSINGVGLTYDEIDVTAFQDAMKGAIAGQPDFVLTVTGPFDNTAATAASGTGAAATLSGSHTVLSGIAGGGTPLTIGCYFGIRGYWASGDPVFGIASSATNGVTCFEYTVDPSAMTYSAKFRAYPGTAALAWGTAALA
jgi:hypothetical protein